RSAPVPLEGPGSWTPIPTAKAARSATRTVPVPRRPRKPGLLVGPDLVCDSAAQTQIPLSSVLNAMAVEDYRKNHWPNLEKAIDRLLIQNPADHVSVSYAQIYGYIYKCVCQQHSELLYRDLTSKITAHLQQVSTQLQASPAENLIENFNAALTQFTASLQCIVPVFIYFNKFYIESKLNRDLKGDLMQLFAEHVAEKHLSALMHLLITAHSKPFQVQPSTMASVVKGLYSLQPEPPESKESSTQTQEAVQEMHSKPKTTGSPSFSALL
uniref:CDK2 associated cullin domain 1 n=1 Tax=Oryzias sinensis TaxID=183150 RepID=A0A8C8DQM9_9TELE